MQRRDFITLLGGAAAAGLRPVGALAQSPTLPEIGLLNSLSFLPILDRLEAFFEKIEEAGFVADQNLSVEFRSAEGRAEILPELAAATARPVSVSRFSRCRSARMSAACW